MSIVKKAYYSFEISYSVVFKSLDVITMITRAYTTSRTE